MDNVAELLDVSKATVYKYFKSREEIVELCVAVKLDEIQHFSGILTDEKTPFLDRYFLSLEDLTKNVADISNTFLSDLKHLFPETWETVNNFIEYALQILQQYYVEGIAKGMLRKVKPSLMVMSDRFFLQALSDPDFLDSHQLTLKEAFRQYFEMKFFGIVKG
jgi:AcrR family transcriptional regulator